MIFKQLGFGHRAINNKMKFVLVALAILLSIVHSEAYKLSPGEEPGVKSDILKRKGTFAPWEQQPVDLSLSEDEIRKLIEGIKTNEQPGVKSDILKRKGAFDPMEQQPVDLSDLDDEVLRQL